MELLVLTIIIVSLCVQINGFETKDQDWGYIDVRKDAHMFWWLYKTTANVPSITDRPLVIWLQGGPGGSSTGYGNFEEIGPLDINLKPRNTTWVKEFNVLFIDNPVGTGFSYVDNNSAFTTTNKEIAIDLVTCIKGFYIKRPEFENVPLYIASESYGGKMAIEFALELISEHKKQGKETNLKGVQLIDSWISPIETILSWAPYLYQLGAVDKQGYEDVDKSARKTEKQVLAGNWKAATTGFINTEYRIMDVAKNINFYNVLTIIRSSSRYDPQIVKPGTMENSRTKLSSLMNGPIRKALGVDIAWGVQSNAVFNAQVGDFMKPVTQLVERALNETDLILQVVTGQLDLIVATPGTLQWVDELNWKQSYKWKSVERNALVANGINEGYVKKLGNFALYWVNRAGHMVPADNTFATRVILKDLTGF